MGLTQIVFFCVFQIMLNHFCYQVFEGDLWCPAKFFFGFGRVAKQGFHFCGPEVFGVYSHNDVACFGVDALFIYAFALPVDVNAHFSGGDGDKIPHRVLLPRGYDKVFGFILLEHEPLHLYVVFGVAPVSFCVQVAKVETLLEIEADAGQGTGDLAGDKGFTAQGGLVVEEDTVAGIYAVGLPVVDTDPVGVELGHSVGAPGVERGGFRLGDLLDLAEQLRGGGLVKFGFLFKAQEANALQDAQGAKAVGVRRVFRGFKGDRHMALGRQVINLVRPHLLQNTNQLVESVRSP